MAEVKLLGAYGSPFSRRIEIVLKLKGIPYDYVEEDLSNKSALLLKHNPVHKKVPVLLHNDKPIVESLVIVEYIDETFSGTCVLPKDPYERALARFWAKFVDDKCIPALWKSIWSKGEEQEKAKEEAGEALKVLENELKDKKFFGGDNINFVDIAANFIALWLGVLERVAGLKILTEEEYRRLCAWITEYLNCSVIKENMPSRDILVPHFQRLFQSANTTTD